MLSPRGLRRHWPRRNCNPTEVTLRLSFKTGRDTDYEPEDWDGNQDERLRLVHRRIATATTGTTASSTRSGTASPRSTTSGRRATSQGTQCAIDYWRDANGNVQNYEVDAERQLPHRPARRACRFPIAERPAVHAERRRRTTCTATRTATAPRTSASSTTRTGSVVNPGSRCDEFTQQVRHPALRPADARRSRWYYGPQSRRRTLFAVDGQRARPVEPRGQARRRRSARSVEAQARRASTPVGRVINGTDAQRSADLTSRPKRGMHRRRRRRRVPDDLRPLPQPGHRRRRPGVRRDRALVAARSGDLRYNIVDIIHEPAVAVAVGHHGRRRRSAHRREGAGEHQRVGRRARHRRRRARRI